MRLFHVGGVSVLLDFGVEALIRVVESFILLFYVDR